MVKCIFCEIASRKASTRHVYEDDLVYAMMSLEQPTPYKVLVVPRAHVEAIYNLNDELAAAVFKAAVRVARAVRDASGCEGLSIVQSNGKVAGQELQHFHLHLVPRFAGDEIVLLWDNRPAPTETLERLARDIKAFIFAD